MKIFVISNYVDFTTVLVYLGYVNIVGHAVAQLVETLRCKSEGRGFDSRGCHWNFSLALPFRPQYGPEVDSASNRNISWG
jgi:hypothetical protein